MQRLQPELVLGVAQTAAEIHDEEPQNILWYMQTLDTKAQPDPSHAGIEEGGSAAVVATELCRPYL